MTTLYKPVLIESAEQALNLPGQTVFIADAGDRYDHRGDGRLRLPNGVDLASDLAAGRQVTALVPIDAEEETTVRYAMRLHGDSYTTPPRQKLPGPARRLVTPWEDA